MRQNFPILTIILLRTSRSDSLAEINFKAEVKSNYFIIIRRVSLTCKFSFVHCLPVCLLSNYSLLQTSTLHLGK
ncbi:hypothetical protein T12_11265, partial [Trichinella patagoniensis]